MAIFSIEVLECAERHRAPLLAALAILEAQKQQRERQASAPRFWSLGVRAED